MKTQNLVKVTIISMIFLSFISIIAFAEAEDNITLDSGIKQIQEDWAITKYKSKSKDEKIDGYRKCVSRAQELTKIYPSNPESLIWEGICLASEAELTKLSALGKVKKAKLLFEKAAKINDRALDGSAYTNLGVLHHRVPGSPIGFGDPKIAEKYFKKVLAIAPNNIDANYFYALFLEDEKKDYKLALYHLNIALESPSRNRPLADSERKKEITNKIEEIKKKL